MVGDRISRGIEVNALDHEKLWAFKPVIKVGDRVSGGDIFGTVQETPVVEQRIMVPYDVEGTVEWIFSGEATIMDPVLKDVYKRQGQEYQSFCWVRFVWLAPTRSFTTGRPWQSCIAVSAGRGF